MQTRTRLIGRWFETDRVGPGPIGNRPVRNIPKFITWRTTNPPQVANSCQRMACASSPWITAHWPTSRSESGRYCSTWPMEGLSPSGRPFGRRTVIIPVSTAAAHFAPLRPNANRIIKGNSSRHISSSWPTSRSLNTTSCSVQPPVSCRPTNCDAAIRIGAPRDCSL